MLVIGKVNKKYQIIFNRWQKIEIKTQTKIEPALYLPIGTKISKTQNKITQTNIVRLSTVKFTKTAIKVIHQYQR